MSIKSGVEANEKIGKYEKLVEELMKETPDLVYVRKLCRDLKITYSGNVSTQIGNVFNKLQTIKAQAMTK